MSDNKNKQAFPVQDFYTIDGRMADGWQGLTKREYFTARIIQGLLSNGSPKYNEFESTATYAIDLADELLKALEQ